MRLTPSSIPALASLSPALVSVLTISRLYLGVVLIFLSAYCLTDSMKVRSFVGIAPPPIYDSLNVLCYALAVRELALPAERILVWEHLLAQAAVLDAAVGTGAGHLLGPRHTLRYAFAVKIDAHDFKTGLSPSNFWLQSFADNLLVNY
jgi:hypothetical protein